MTERSIVSGPVVAVILARGGSKGIPRKNLATVGGVPLVVRAIRSCLAAELVDDVLVSTEDDEIARISEAAGALVIDRPAALASDEASSESGVLHALDEYQLQTGVLPTVSLLVQCTSPFTRSTDIDAVVRTLVDSNADCCLLAAPAHRFLWRRHPVDGRAVAVNHDEKCRLRRQDLEPEYVETGAVYGFRTAGFITHQHRFFGKVVLCETDAALATEIDSPDDLLVAQALHGVLASREPPQLPAQVSALVMDFDGVMTDNRVVVLSDGTEGIVANRSDGLGLARFRQSTNVAMLVLSTETDAVVKRRCDKLGLECLAGQHDKAPALADWLRAHRVDPAHCVYIGNDINDLECMKMVGFAVAPSDAVAEVRQIAHLVLHERGGHGAVRELVDLLAAHVALPSAVR